MKKLQLFAFIALLGAVSLHQPTYTWSWSNKKQEIHIIDTNRQSVVYGDGDSNIMIMGSQTIYGGTGTQVTIINGQIINGPNQTIIKDAGKAETKEVNIAGVNKINAAGWGNLTIEQCVTCPEILTITAGENIMPYLKHEVSGKQLKLGFKDNIIVQGITPLTFHAVVKNINKISTSGSIDTTITNQIKTNSLELDMSGASKINGSINVNTLIADLSGATQVTLDGKATNQKISISGASKYNASKLSSESIRIGISGAAKAWLHANNKLHYNASGASQLFYRGNAEVTGSTSGVAKAKKV